MLHSNSIVVRPTPHRPAAVSALTSVNACASAPVTGAGRFRFPSAACVRRPGSDSVFAATDSGLSQEEPATSSDCYASPSPPAEAGGASGQRRLSAAPRLRSESRALREREAELALLRRTMEQNEAALMRVFEERRAELEDRLRTELSLNSRLAPALTQANRRLRQSEQEVADLRQEAESRAAELQASRAECRRLASEAESRAGRVAQLEDSLAASAGSLEAVTRELLRLRLADGERRRASAAVTMDRGCQTETLLPPPPKPPTPPASVVAEAEALRELLAQAQDRLKEQESAFGAERSQWMDEKCTVVNYQRQLQGHQHQLAVRCQHLEEEVRQLTRELQLREAAPAGRQQLQPAKG